MARHKKNRRLKQKAKQERLPEVVPEQSEAAAPAPVVLAALLAPARAGWDWRRGMVVGVVVVAAGLSGAGLMSSLAHLSVVASARPVSKAVVQDYGQQEVLSAQVRSFEAAQTAGGIAVADDAGLDDQLANIRFRLAGRDDVRARTLMAGVQTQLARDKTKLLAAKAGVGELPGNSLSLNVPILLYHYPPPDFRAQMQTLQDRGYTTIDLDSLAAALIGQATLPGKPVVITFDDGFEAQQAASVYLAAHRMKATFFIIDGGAASNYCIGANRHPGPCGDAYLTWSQIEQLDRNPLFTIASHTVDHLELSKQSPSVQQFQILEGKKELEQHLGHLVDDFAYPYGAFNATTLQFLHQDGFITAVTTAPGTLQTGNSLLTLSRIRDTYSLP